MAWTSVHGGLRFLREPEMTKHSRYGDICNHYAKTRGRCHLCKKELPDAEDFGQIWLWGRNAPTMDHVIPQSHGGEDSDENLLPAHLGCNASRGTEPVEDARERLSGSRTALMSQAGVNTISAGLGAGAGTWAGVHFAPLDPQTGKRTFNWGAALTVGGATTLLALLFAG